MKSKVISIFTVFIFSALIWVFVSLSDEYSIQLSVPVLIKNLPSNFKVSSVNPTHLNIFIKGRGWQLIQFELGEIENYVVDVNNSQNIGKLSTKKYLANNNWLTLNTQVISIEPEVIKIKVEKGFSKKVKISPNIVLSFKEGYGLVSEVICKPDSVQLYGPWSKTILIDGILTEKAVVDNIETVQSLTLKLIKPDYISMNIDETEISFAAEKIVDKRFDNIEIEKINVPHNRELILSPNSIAIVLKGGIQKLAGLNPQNLRAFIDFNQALADTVGTLEPTIVCDKFFEVIDIIPNKIKYVIKQY